MQDGLEFLQGEGLVFSEEYSECVFDFTDLVYLNGGVGEVHSFERHLGYDDFLESEFLCLKDALLESCDGSYFAGESDFSGEADVAGDGYFEAAAEDGSKDGEVDCGVVDSQASGDVEEDVFLYEFESCSFFEHGEQHIESTGVESGAGALWCTVGRCADECLYFDEEWSDAFDGGCDADSGESFVVGREE